MKKITFDKTLAHLSGQALPLGIEDILKGYREDLFIRDVLSSPKLATSRIEEEFRRQVEYIASGYGLGDVARDIVEREAATRLALSNSYANLVGIDLPANDFLADFDLLQRRVEKIVSPADHLRNLVSEFSAPSGMLEYIDELDIAGGLIGEFAFSDISSESSTTRDSEGVHREQVKSRIIQVNYLPQKTFERIRNDPRIMRGLTPREFEEFTAELLLKLGFKSVQLTPRSRDGGRDVIATQVVNDIPVIMAFECKQNSETNKVGPELLRALLGTITHGSSRASMGVLVTTSSFTTGAKSFIAAEATIDGKDFAALANWLSQLSGRCYRPESGL